MGHILVINSGSSSIKFAVFDGDLSETLSGRALEIGGAASLLVGRQTVSLPLPDHAAALQAILTALGENGIDVGALNAVAHRIVHGGQGLTAPCHVTPEVLAKIEACNALAPLHNPHNLAGIHAVSQVAPDLAQFASFDTAFHSTNPEVALRYAVPQTEDARGIRRYGFHGISYASLVQHWPEVTGQDLPGRLLAFHLGNGASLCAIRDGRSIATTMGYSPIDGLTMGTRVGPIDANAVLRLAEMHGIAATADLLNRRSGLLGLGGQSDMRMLQQDSSAEARFAVDHFCYWAIRQAGSMIAVLEGVDAIVFTGGIGENDAEIRAQILQGLSWLGLQMDPTANAKNSPLLSTLESAMTAWIIAAKEERGIARDALGLLSDTARG